MTPVRYIPSLVCRRHHKGTEGNLVFKYKDLKKHRWSSSIDTQYSEVSGNVEVTSDYCSGPHIEVPHLIEHNSVNMRNLNFN